MIQLLAPLLGGLGGLLFPAAGAAAAGGAAATGIGALLAKGALPALGAGLGTLVAGGGGKDAIRNALLMGVGVNAFPGLAGKIQGSQFGQSVTEGLAGIFGGGQEQAPMTSPRPMARPEAGLASMSTAGSNMGPPLAAPDGFGRSSMEEDIMGRRAPTTLPSLSEMAALDESRRQREAAEAFDLYGSMPEIESVSPDFFSGARGFESRAGLPADLDEYLDRMETTGIPATLPPVIMPGSGINREEQLSDMQRALDMTREPMSLLSAISPATHRQAFAQRRERDNALLDIYNRRARPGLRGFAMGGEIEGPGTGTSDSIPAEIYQDGKPVQKAALSDGEFVMTADAVKGAGKGNRERGVSRMYELMRRFESGEMA